MSYDAVIFDLDGTLLDTIEDLTDSMNAVLVSRGCATHGVEAYKLFVGEGMVRLVKRALPVERRDRATVATCAAAMADEYGGRWDHKTRPYPGVEELLDALTERGVRLAILSNKPEDATRTIVDRFLGRWPFDAVMGDSSHRKRKPDPGGALSIAKGWGLRPEEVLYLGDTGTDMETASGAGMYAVGALWGFRDADELVASGAKELIERPTDLLKLVGGAKGSGEGVSRP